MKKNDFIFELVMSMFAMALIVFLAVKMAQHISPVMTAYHLPEVRIPMKYCY